MDTIDELISATDALPETIRRAVARALSSGDLSIGAGSWQSELAVCPVAAGAIEAGVWERGGIAAGADEWGTPEGPSAAVEEFAAWFDICAEDEGLPLALETVRRTLGALAAHRSRAASRT